jgi:nicotinamide-nucleotide amidase
MNPIHLIIIGDELLAGKRQDKHLQKIASTLADRGADLTSCEAIRDVSGAVTEAVAKHLGGKNLIITTGGLGPTLDDLTREGIAAATGTGLRFDEGLWVDLKQRYERKGRKISESSRSQALVPEKGTFFLNHFGTAPGLVFECAEHPQCLVVALPGPPRELNPMWDHQALPFLAEKYQWPAPPHRVLLRFVMAPEAGIDEKMRPILTDHPEVGLSSLIRIGRVDVTLSLPSDYPEGLRLLESIADATQNAFPIHVFSRTLFTGEGLQVLIDLEDVILEQLRQRRQTLSTAESCTGGLVAKWLTDSPGSSDVFWGGVVAYDNSLKMNLLDVAPGTLEAEGAVSESTAREMVQGLLKTTKTHWGIGITGIAGPGGGNEEKPVGLVFVAVGNQERIETKRFEFPGNREYVRELAANVALWMLWRRLVE